MNYHYLDTIIARENKTIKNVNATPQLSFEIMLNLCGYDKLCSDMK
jgi:hypothetical protein